SGRKGNVLTLTNEVIASRTQPFPRTGMLRASRAILLPIAFAAQRCWGPRMRPAGRSTAQGRRVRGGHFGQVAPKWPKTGKNRPYVFGNRTISCYPARQCYHNRVWLDIKRLKTHPVGSPWLWHSYWPSATASPQGYMMSEKDDQFRSRFE